MALVVPFLYIVFAFSAIAPITAALLQEGRGDCLGRIFGGWGLSGWIPLLGSTG